MTPTELSKAAAISVPYASQLLADPPLRSPSLELALRIYDATGAKMGALEKLDEVGIETARKMARAA